MITCTGTVCLIMWGSFEKQLPYLVAFGDLNLGQLRVTQHKWSGRLYVNLKKTCRDGDYGIMTYV